MNGRVKMLMAQEAARRRGNDYGNPRDNEKPNNNYGGYNNGEMRDRPYYAGDRAPVNIIMPPVRYDGNGGEKEYRGGNYGAYNGPYPPPMYEEYEPRRIGFGGNSKTGGNRKEINSRNLYFDGSAGRHSSGHKVTKEQAHEWTEEMENSDGSRGEHWSMEQVKKLSEKMGFSSIDPVEFYVAVNMMYSDYCGVAKKFNADTPEFYGHMAKAFLEDKDTKEGKLTKYFENIVNDD